MSSYPSSDTLLYVSTTVRILQPLCLWRSLLLVLVLLERVLVEGLVRVLDPLLLLLLLVSVLQVARWSGRQQALHHLRAEVGHQLGWQHAWWKSDAIRRLQRQRESRLRGILCEW